MNDSTFEFHDGMWFDCASFLEHDSLHANVKCTDWENLDNLDDFLKAIEGYIDYIYKDLKQMLSADLFLLLEHLVFLTTHEYLYLDKQFIFRKIRKISPLTLLALYFDVNYKIYSDHIENKDIEKYSRGFLSAPMTDQEKRLRSLLESKELGVWLEKIFNILQQEINSAWKGKRIFSKEKVVAEIQNVENEFCTKHGICRVKRQRKSFCSSAINQMIPIKRRYQTFQ